MNDYLGRDKTEKKKESVIGKIKKFKAEEKSKPKEKKEASKEAERWFCGRCGLTAPIIFCVIMFEKTEYNSVISLIYML